MHYLRDIAILSLLNISYSSLCNCKKTSIITSHVTSVLLAWIIISGILVWDIHKGFPSGDFSFSLYLKASSSINLQTRVQADCLENMLTEFLSNSWFVFLCAWKNNADAKLASLEGYIFCLVFKWSGWSRKAESDCCALMQVRNSLQIDIVFFLKH